MEAARWPTTPVPSVPNLPRSLTSPDSQYQPHDNPCGVEQHLQHHALVVPLGDQQPGVDFNSHCAWHMQVIESKTWDSASVQGAVP